MKQRKQWSALLLAGAGSWASTQGCHEFHVCGDQPCDPARAGASSSAGNAGSNAATRGGAGGAAGTSFGSASGAGGSPDHAGGAGGSLGRAGGAGGSPDRAGGAGGTGGSLGRAGGAGGSLDAAGGSAGAWPGGAGGEESQAGQAGSNTNASEAGSGGTSGVAECVFPRADCDESVFTGCEANLLTDIRNCGACRARCAGACIDGRCSPFETLAEDMWLPPWGGITRTSSEVYALSTVIGNTLVRWSAQQGAQTLFTGSDGFQELLSGVDRLYLRNFSGGLWSISRTGGTVASEGITASAAVIQGKTLYAVDAAKVPYWRTEISQETGALPLPAPVADSADVWLAADSFNVALVTKEGDSAAPTYNVYYLVRGRQSPWVWITSGSGTPAQIRVENYAVYIDVVLPHDETVADWQIEHELREVDFGGVTRVISALTGLLDFELVNSRLYLSVALPQNRSMLRVLALANPSSVLDVQTSATMASLTYVRPYFYFGDSLRKQLARLPAWIEPF